MRQIRSLHWRLLPGNKFARECDIAFRSRSGICVNRLLTNPFQTIIKLLPKGALVFGRGESRRLHSTEFVHYLMLPP